MEQPNPINDRDLYKEVLENRPIRPPKQWKVLPHGKLTQLDDNLLTVTGELRVPMTLPRRMTVVRRKNSRLSYSVRSRSTRRR